MAAPRSDRDTLLAVVSGVAVGLLALSFPSPIAYLGLIPAVVASLDLLRRRQLTAVGVLLVTAALSAGLPSGWTLFGAARTAGVGLPAATAAVFGIACGALILGVMVLLLEQGDETAPTPAPATDPQPSEPTPVEAAPPEPAPEPVATDEPVTVDEPPR
jgi:outer membrane biosynthesis protein TonB